jgi:uncharacterized membrane protein YfcA
VSLGTVLVIVLAMSVGSFVKGATGLGLPQIAIPVMATFLGVEPAVVIMAIPGVVANTWLLWNYRGHFGATRDLPALLVMGTIGAILGTLLLDTLNENILALVLAGMIGAYVLIFFTHPHLRIPPRITRFTAPPVGLAAGVLQGATGISGPLLSTYLHGYRLPREAFIVSITTMFQVYSVVQTITLASIGLYTSRLLLLSVLSLIPIMTLLPLGARMTDRLSRRTFDLVVLTLLSAAAVKLAFDGLT